MLGPDSVGISIEVHKVASPDIDGARAEARYPGVQAIKVDQALQRVFKIFGVVETSSRKRPAGLQPGRHGPRGEETSRTAGHGQAGAHLIEDIAGIIAARQILEGLG